MNEYGERIPPQDLDAERGILGGMLLSARAVEEVIDIVKGRDFYLPKHEQIFAAVTFLFGRDEPADGVTVANELGRRGQLGKIGGPAYLHELMGSVPTSASAGWYADIVRQHAQRRRLIDAGTRAVQMGYATDGDDIIEVIDKAQAEMQALSDAGGFEDEADSRADSVTRVLEGMEKHGPRGLPTGFKDLDSLLGGGFTSGQMIIVAARPAMGKALALDTPLPTPTGWTTMGDVRVGDRVIGADGLPCTVTAATDVMHDRPCYEVEFSDGSIITADADHQWFTDTRASLKSAQAAAAKYNRYRNQKTFPAVRTTREIAATLRVSAEARANHSIVNAAAVKLPEVELPVGSYTLGAWLGDGTTDQAHITSPDPEVIAEIEKEGYRTCARKQQHDKCPAFGIYLQPRPPLDDRDCAVCGVTFTPYTMQIRTCGRVCGGKAKGLSGPQPACPDCGKPFTGLSGTCRECRYDHGTVQALLRKIGVLGNKHIPVEYLRASEDQRRALLAGLLDTDGYCSKGGTIQFAVVKEQLARDVWELVLSLGYKATFTSKPARLYGKDCGTAWMVTFTTSDQVFRLPRKGDRIREKVSPITERRFITDIRPVKSVPVRCIQVDSNGRLYLAGRNWIPTHNSTLGLDIARHVSGRLELPSIFFSLEMSHDELTMRQLSAEAKVSLHRMRSGTTTDEDWARLAKHRGTVSDSPLHVDDDPGLTLMQIRTKARRHKRKHGLALIIVDYVQLLHSGVGNGRQNRQEEVSELSRGLKLLGKELGVPVIAIAQLNRGPEQRTDKKPMMSDLRESGSLEQDADIVILLHREAAYEPESPRAGEADLIVAKHRNGPTGTITVEAQLHYARFCDFETARWSPSGATG